MSSHHVVREKQEPALVVLGLAGFNPELLGQLLEWSPTVIATRQTAPLLNESSIKVDCILSDEGYHEQRDVKTISPGTDSAAEAALKYLVTNGYPAVNLITDTLQLKDYLFYADKISLVIFYNGQKIYAVNSGFSKWKPAGEMIEVLTHPNELHCNGLEPLGRHRFRTTADGFFSLKFDKPFLFIAEQL